MTTIDDNRGAEIPQKADMWRCQSCGHKFSKPWPKDRAKFYASGACVFCPRCKSHDAMPVGF